MIDEFKNLELLRHQISTRFNKSLKENLKQTQSNAEKILSAIFSAACSVALSVLSHNYVDKNNFTGIIFGLFVFSVSYILVYWGSKYLLKIGHGIHYNSKIHGTNLSNEQKNELINQFDHIVCDNNLAVKSFIRAFEDESDSDIKEFEFYEIYYYTSVAINITINVMNRHMACVNTLKEATGIDLYRIYNQLSMMKNAVDFMLDVAERPRDYIQESMRPVIELKIYQLLENLNELERKCNECLAKNFSNEQMKEITEKVNMYKKRKQG